MGVSPAQPRLRFPRKVALSVWRGVGSFGSARGEREGGARWRTTLDFRDFGPASAFPKILVPFHLSLVSLACPCAVTRDLSRCLCTVIFNQIEAYGLAHQWLKGCNEIGRPHAPPASGEEGQ